MGDVKYMIDYKKISEPLQSEEMDDLLAKIREHRKLHPVHSGLKPYVGRDENDFSQDYSFDQWNR